MQAARRGLLRAWAVRLPVVREDHRGGVALERLLHDFARVTPKRLLEACLRMRPDRILLAELRSDEAYYYLRNVNSGHPGSITSVHASSAVLAFEQLTLLVKESPAGRELPRAEILALLHQLVDVVVQCAVSDSKRLVREIWFKELNIRLAP